jgi:hypothetical protein
MEIGQSECDVHANLILEKVSIKKVVREWFVRVFWRIEVLSEKKMNTLFRDNMDGARIWYSELYSIQIELINERTMRGI